MSAVINREVMVKLMNVLLFVTLASSQYMKVLVRRKLMAIVILLLKTHLRLHLAKVKRNNKSFFFTGKEWNNCLNWAQNCLNRAQNCLNWAQWCLLWCFKIDERWSWSWWALISEKLGIKKATRYFLSNLTISNMVEHRNKCLRVAKF